MSVHGYHHIGLIVKDGNTSLAFYTEGLGGKHTFSFPMGETGKSIHMVDIGGNAVVELIPQGKGDPETNARFSHIALATDDARGDYARALAAGALSRTEPKDILLGTKPVCIAFVTGPDAEVIEFFQEK